MEDEKEGAGKFFDDRRWKTKKVSEWTTFNTLARHEKILSGKDYWASQLS